MTEQTTDLLVKEILESFQSVKKTGAEMVDALYEQAPEVINQLLLWHAIESLVMCVIGLTALSVPFLMYKVVRKLYNRIEVNKLHDPFNFWFPVCVLGIPVVICALLFSINMLNLTWLKIYIAPKVYMIEYLSQIVK